MEECDFLPIIFDIIVGLLFPSKQKKCTHNTHNK